jgi:hypothetical protein
MNPPSLHFSLYTNLYTNNQKEQKKKKNTTSANYNKLT